MVLSQAFREAAAMTLRLLRALCPARAPHKARTPTELVRAVLSGNPVSSEQAVLSPLSPGRTNRVLAALFFGMFVLGCAELLVVGLLNLIACTSPSRRPGRW
jgi:hypothetical protein